MLHRIYIKSNKSNAILWLVQHADMYNYSSGQPNKNKRKEARLHGVTNFIEFGLLIM